MEGGGGCFKQSLEFLIQHKLEKNCSCLDALSFLYSESHLAQGIKQANPDFLSGTSSTPPPSPPSSTIPTTPPPAQLAVGLLACKDTAGNKQPHVLLPFKLEAVETNSDVFVFGIRFAVARSRRPTGRRKRRGFAFSLEFGILHGDVDEKGREK